MPEVYPLARELNLFDPAQVHFSRNAFEELVLERGAESMAGIQLRRGFPFSAAERFISVRDREDRELGIIGDLKALDPESRRLVEQELEQLYFTPRITAIKRIEERFHVPRWEVETDRGPRTFEIRSGRNDLRLLPGGRILIRDADGNQYEIPDYHRLDPQSRAQVETQV